MQQIALDIGLASGPTLGNFLPGPNEAALRHLQLWTLTSQPAPVPAYLWGASGVGKTHLLKAVREALRERGAVVGWLDPTQADPPDFDGAWTAVLMDDVQRYDAVQQQMAFNWFVNALTPTNGAPRWVLAAGSLPPADLLLREDLRTRLGWGHVFALQALGEAGLRAVLRQQADARGVFLRDDVMDFMLSRFSRDLGNLSTLLDALDRYALQTRRALTIPLVKAMLEESD